LPNFSAVIDTREPAYALLCVHAHQQDCSGYIEKYNKVAKGRIKHHNQVKECPLSTCQCTRKIHLPDDLQQSGRMRATAKLPRQRAAVSQGRRRTAICLGKVQALPRYALTKIKARP
jgi:hypothetical protein